MESNSQPVGIFYSWWRGDALPYLPHLADLSIEPGDGDESVAVPPFLEQADVSSLEREGHRLYLAHLDEEVVAFGWAATATAAIGELGIDMPLPPRNRYLWGFVTLPRWRGKGIYPRIIQTMLIREADVERFWIGHDYDNVPSARGIIRAGFSPVGEVYRCQDGGLRFVPSGHPERSAAAAALLGLPVASG